MKVTADHVMKFEWVDDSPEKIPDIPNPVYIPHVGEIVTFNLLDQAKSEFFNLTAKVTGIKVTVYDTIVGEQILTVYISKNLDYSV